MLELGPEVNGMANEGRGCSVSASMDVDEAAKKIEGLDEKLQNK